MFEVMHKCSLTGQLCPSTHKDAGTQPCNLCPVTFPERKEPNAGVRVVGHACKLDGSICESRPDRCSDCPAGAGGKS